MGAALGGALITARNEAAVRTEGITGMSGMFCGRISLRTAHSVSPVTGFTDEWAAR